MKRRPIVTNWYDSDTWTPHYGTGAAHCVDSTPMEQYGGRVEALHAIVEEVTGCPVVRAERSFGFLP